MQKDDKLNHFSSSLEKDQYSKNSEEKENNLINTEVSNNESINSKKDKKNEKIKEKNFNRLTCQFGQKSTIGQNKQNFSLDNLGDIELAKKHRSANRPLNKIKNDFDKETQFCPCCNLPCEQKGIIEPFKFCDKIEEFGICGNGIYLYFVYISFAVGCNLIIILFSSITFNIFSNKYYNNVLNLCKINDLEIKNKCENHKNINKDLNLDNVNFFYKLSIVTIKSYRDLCIDLIRDSRVCDKSILNYSVINFCCMLALLFFNIVCLYVFHDLNKKNKEKIEIIPSDYTLFITNLNKYYENFNKKIKNQFNIKEFISYLKEELFDSISKNKDISKNIYSINLCYKINEYIKKQKKLEEYKYKIFQIRYNPYQIKKNNKLKIIQKDEQYYFLMPFTFFGCLFSLKKEEKLKDLKSKKTLIETELKNSMDSGRKLNKFAGCIFAYFNTVQDKENFYNNFPHYFIEKMFFFFKNIKYFIDYYLLNKEESEKYLIKLKLKIYHANEPEDVIWENLEYSSCQRFIRRLFIYLVSLLLLSILFIIVFLLTNFQNNLYKKENWKFIKINIVSYSIAIAIVIVNKLFQILLELLTEIEKPRSFTEFYLSCSIKLTIFSFITSAIIPFICNNFRKDNNLMIKNISNLFIVNAIVLPIPFTLIEYFYKKFKIWSINRNPTQHYKTQRELNELYELPDMNISYKYSDICQTILMTFFYMSIFPFGAIISSLGLVANYFGQKYYFIHFYKRPEMLNESICKFYLEYFIIDLLIYAIGDYIFTNKNFKKNNWSLLNLVLFAILTIIPYNKLILLYLDKRKKIKKCSTPISKVFFKFYNDYERQNPITKKEGLLKYFENLKKKRIIPKKMLKISTNNVENINLMEAYYRSSLRKSLMISQFYLANYKKLKKGIQEKKHISNESNKYLNNIQEAESKNIEDKKSNNNEEDDNNINNSDKEKEFSEEIDIKEILLNNNSLMRKSYRNPALIGIINESIRFSVNIFENLNERNNISNNNMRKTINKNLNSIANENNRPLANIFENSKEEDENYNYNTAILNSITQNNSINNIDINVDIESKDSKYELYNKNNQLHKSLNNPTISKNSKINDSSRNKNLHQSYKIEKSDINDLTKSANLGSKQSILDFDL